MYITHRSLLTALLLTCSLNVNALQIIRTPEANDDHHGVVVGEFTSASGNVGTNDLYGTTFILNGSGNGKYGVISFFDSEGEYTYQLFNGVTNADLPSGQETTDRFEYTYENSTGLSDTATLIISVSPNQAESQTPVANNDHASVIIKLNPTISGDMSINDLNGSIISFDVSTVGKYGFISLLDSSGKYLYQLFENTSNADLPSQGVDTESFTYTLSTEDGNSDQAQLIIEVNANSGDSPSAKDDNTTVVSNKAAIVSGDVTANDSNGDYVQLLSSPTTKFGLLILQPDGNYIYELYESAPDVITLVAGEVVVDEFEYEYFSNSGESAIAKLVVQIIGNPIDGNGDTVFEQPEDEPFDNVDVEFNNRSAQATPLNSGRNIRGHLYDSGDKDWYALASEGDEIITLEVCPKGSNCFDKKSWVLYVFDSDLITPEMEGRVYTFDRWVTETGTDKDLLGNVIISRTTAIPATSNHMYLAYRAGFFEGALIGVVDPCFDALNKVEIGVGKGARNYLIAISSPLRGDADDETDTAGPCGAGSVVLNSLGISAVGLDAEGKPKTYTTTVEGIIASPNSDDQYAIKISNTGLNPLLSEEAEIKSATYNSITGELKIPKVRIVNDFYEASLLQQEPQARSTENSLNFIITNIDTLSFEDVIDNYRATFNPENQQVLIPRVTDTVSGKAYSVILRYHASNENGQPWLEVISIDEIL